MTNDRVVSVDNGVETTRENAISTGLTGWSFARCNSAVCGYGPNTGPNND